MNMVKNNRISLIAALVSLVVVQNVIASEQRKGSAAVEAAGCFDPDSGDVIGQVSPGFNDYSEFLDGICLEYGKKNSNASDQVWRLIWGAGIEQYDAYLKIFLDIMSKKLSKQDEKRVNEAVACLKGVGSTECLVGRGKVVAAALAAGLIASRPKKTGQIAEPEKPLRHGYEIENEAIGVIAEIHHGATPAAREAAKTRYDQLLSEPSLESPRFDKFGSDQRTENMLRGAAVAGTIIVGALAVEAAGRLYQSRADQQKWDDFKTTPDYKKRLASHFNILVGSYDVLKLINKIITRMYDLTPQEISENSEWYDRLRLLIENLHDKVKRKDFACVLTKANRIPVEQTVYIGVIMRECEIQQLSWSDRMGHWWWKVTAFGGGFGLQELLKLPIQIKIFKELLNGRIQYTKEHGGVADNAFRSFGE